MANFRHLLVPVDFSEANRIALDIAKRMALQNIARVTLLHVIETIDYVIDDEVDAFYETLKLRSQEKLHLLSKTLREEKLSVDEKLVMGKRARGIVSFAVQNDVDLVVMSSHKLDPNEPRSGFGSISHQVSVFCPCAVLLVK